MPRTTTRPKAVPFAHRYGCPATPERMERYDAVRSSGEEITVTHCMDCGEMSYSDREAVMAPHDDDDEGMT